MLKARLTLTLVCALVVGIVWMSPTPSYAVHIPTHGAVTHLDLNPVGVIDVLPAFPGVPPVPAPVVGGPSGAFATGEFVFFGDGLLSTSLWHWESEIVNVNPFAVAFNVGFFFPNGGGPIIGRLGLRAGGTFHIDIHVQDFPPEVGPWVWFAFSGLPFPIGIDTSVTENLTAGPEFPGQFNFHFHSDPDDFFVIAPNLTPELSMHSQIVPEPSTLLLFGVSVLGLIGYGWWHRKQAAA